MDVYDHMYRLWPTLDLSVVIDDSTLQASGHSKQIFTTITQATKFACKKFQELRMIVSVDKGQVVASQGSKSRGRLLCNSPRTGFRPGARSSSSGSIDEWYAEDAPYKPSAPAG